ncbi:DIS3-like exonuclease 2 [Saccostrea echinata]|uniref:DIS3-like exonuclease 2 n=1 Tax=Saccostrea echinata TaxID=191078 RepID=UPI002A81A948|nr:DIS3-like exonuclease 2 [Saccostrea echinata]
MAANRKNDLGCGKLRSDMEDSQSNTEEGVSSTSKIKANKSREDLPSKPEEGISSKSKTKANKSREDLQSKPEEGVSSKSKKANKSRENVGSYTQLLRQHRRRSPRDLMDQEDMKIDKPNKKKVCEMIAESAQRSVGKEALTNESVYPKLVEDLRDSALNSGCDIPVDIKPSEKKNESGIEVEKFEKSEGQNDSQLLNNQAANSLVQEPQSIESENKGNRVKGQKEKRPKSGKSRQGSGGPEMSERGQKNERKGKKEESNKPPNDSTNKVDRPKSGKGRQKERENQEMVNASENQQDENGKKKKPRNRRFVRYDKENESRPNSENLQEGSDENESRNGGLNGEELKKGRRSERPGSGRNLQESIKEDLMEKRDNAQGKGHNRGKKNKGQPQNNRGQSAKTQCLFEHYWSAEEISAGLKRGELLEGQFRINVKNYEECFIDHPDGKRDILISGMKDRNRAFHGDIVVVQLKDKLEWRVHEKHLTDLEEEHRQKCDEKNSSVVDTSDVVTDTIGATGNSNSGDKDASGSQADSQKNTPKATPQKKYLSVHGALTNNSPVIKKLFHEEAEKKDEHLESKLLQPTAKVVAILEKRNNRACTGNISLMTDKNKNWAFFKPIDSRMPRMRIPMSECPKDFYERPDDYKNTLFICRIIEWKDNMQAFGSLMKSLGEAGQIEPETEGMLIENDVDSSEFPQEAIDSLPVHSLPWRIPAEEYESRRDFRSQCVFTIDPSTARDLDDALSCEKLPDGNYEVGVHIADVSYFLKEGTVLDKIAGHRATSVYLVQKVIPMLPRILCEELCSLNPDEDRLTFSVVWKISEKGEIYEEWFGRSVIKSCCKLAYEHVQGFIEQPDKDWTKEELPPISEKFSVQEIKDRTLNLHKIAVNLRKQRMDSGALRLDQVKLQFCLNDETGLPNGYSIYQQKDSNRLVEEFMLLANMAVAHKTYSVFDKQSLLRRHPPPKSKMMEDMRDLCASLGVPIDIDSAGDLQRSLWSYLGNDEFSGARMQVLVSMCSKPMQNAVYFCTGCLEDEELYRHYALNVPLYTHFTSPIRRYADVIVHRTLSAALGYSPEISLTPQQINKQALQCNEKKTNSKRVQELSVDLYFSIFVKEAGPFEERAMVMGVLDKAFDVFIMKFGVVKRVYCDKLDIKDKIFIKEQKQSVMTLIWNPEKEGGECVQERIAIFSLVDCVMAAGDRPLQWMATIKPPHKRKKETDDLSTQMDNLELS